MSSTVNNTCNIFYNIVIDDLIEQLTKSDVMTDELKEVCDRLKKPVSGGATNVKETKKPRKSPKVTGYNVYMREYRETVKRERPDLSSQQIVTHMASAWNKEHTEEFRKRFNDRAIEIQKERDAAAA